MNGLVVFGITGRMGRSLLRALSEEAEADSKGAEAAGRAGLRLSGAIASARSSRLGQDAAAEGRASGVIITADATLALVGAAVAMDFSVPDCIAVNAQACQRAGVPLLVGATGMDAATRSTLDAVAAHIAVLIAPNTSVGMNVLAALVGRAVAALGDFDVEIGEAHHRFKRDSPSGTALALGEVAARARGRALQDVAVFDRHGALAPRSPDSIGFSVLRAGDIVGEHTVTLAGAGERLELTHRATDRSAFARGALRAAGWLVGQAPGLYAMSDALNLDES